jgi:hypothetical protein
VSFASTAGSRRFLHRRKPMASNAMIATGIPTPSPIFAPVDKPSGDGVGVPVAVGDFEGSTEVEPGIDTVLACELIVMAEARASTAESDFCQKIGIPSPFTTVAFVQGRVVGVPFFHELSP